MINSERLVNTLLDLVKIDSESRDERKVADYVTKRLTDLGFSVQEDNAGEKAGSNAGNIIAKKKGNTAGPSILFSAHMDTVKPGIGVEPVIKDGVIYSNGDTVLGSDDKAGIASILEMGEVLKETNSQHTDIQVVFTICEECGLLGSKNLQIDLLDPVDAAFIFDSSSLPSNIIMTGPSQSDVDITIHGKSAHAGIAPEEGISAIQIAAEAISHMTLGRLDHETTSNMGIISGGKATNIIPDYVKIDGEIRSIDPQKITAQQEHIKSCVDAAVAKLGGSAEVKFEINYPGISLDENSPTVQIAKKAVENIGLTPELVATGGGSDANIFHGYNIPATNLGVGMSKVHTTDEFIKISDLEYAAKMALQLALVAAE